MRLLRRIYRYIVVLFQLPAGQCDTCGTKLTGLEIELGYTECFVCESEY